MEKIKTEIKKYECYVRFLDSTNKFKETKKDFETYELAWEFIKETFDVPTKDYINFY